MAAYVMATLEATDPAELDAYRRRRVAPQIARHGGQVLAAGAPEVREGEGRPQATVVIEFPTMDQARAWYEAAVRRGREAPRPRCARATLRLLDELPVAPLPREFFAGQRPGAPAPVDSPPSPSAR